MGSAAQGGNVRTRLPGRGITSSAVRASASANDVCRKDRGDGLTVDRRLESPAKKMALVAGVFIVAPDVRISILAMGSPMRPYTLTQTDQSFSKSYLQAGRAIRFLRACAAHRRKSTHFMTGTGSIAEWRVLANIVEKLPVRHRFSQGRCQTKLAVMPIDDVQPHPSMRSTAAPICSAASSACPSSRWA